VTLAISHPLSLLCAYMYDASVVVSPCAIQSGTHSPNRSAAHAARFFFSLFLFLAGFDTYGVAKTGSGKTATFAIPILQRLAKDPFSVFALVLTPTRELAFQISEQFAALGKPIGLRQAVVVGGLDFVQQGVELSRRPHVVVATPGRLADHISGGADVPLRRLQLVVYDEADRLLENASFASDLATIAAALPAARQTLLFTATPLDPACDFFATLREPVHRCEKQHSTQARKHAHARARASIRFPFSL
jgi:ATP-dependent RNA helicase DDX49/DBP8